MRVRRVVFRATINYDFSQADAIEALGKREINENKIDFWLNDEQRIEDAVDDLNGSLRDSLRPSDEFDEEDLGIIDDNEEVVIKEISGVVSLYRGGHIVADLTKEELDQLQEIHHKHCKECQCFRWGIEYCAENGHLR